MPFSFTETGVGSEARVACISSGKNDLKWWKDGNPLYSDQNGISIQQLQGMVVLTITDLQPEHSGNYTCTAQNRHGSSSYSAQLAVASPPNWRQIPEKAIIIPSTLNKSELICDSIGFPEPNITWFKNGGKYGLFIYSTRRHR